MNTDHASTSLSTGLGNILTTISDRKKRIAGANPAFEAVIETAQDYYPFGMLMPGRKYNPAEYRFGFNGQEKDDEITGVTGSHVSFKYRVHDTRLGRFLSLDPLARDYPWNSPYVFAENRVIDGVELEGLEWLSVTGGKATLYDGNYGDTKIVIGTYRTTSGLNENKTPDPNDGYMNYQNAKFQYKKDIGPTVEGGYMLKLEADYNKQAKIKYGQVIRDDIPGIENLEQMINPDDPNPNHRYNAPEWGKNRIRLIPVDVKQPKGPDGEILTGKETRELDSFYLHSSTKGYTHGCTEIEDKFFDDIKKLQDEGTKQINVKVDYSTNQNTYGATDK